MAPPTPVLLPGKSHGWRSLVGCSPWGCWELDTTQWLHFHFSLSWIGEGNGNPFQYSCLENPRDSEARRAAIYGVAQSWTRLKWLSNMDLTFQVPMQYCSYSTRLSRPWDAPGKNTGVGCHFLFQCMTVKSESEVTESCPTLSNPMDCSPPGSSIHGIFQARVLEWGAIAFSIISH